MEQVKVNEQPKEPAWWDDGEEPPEFNMCSGCDGHPACEDFGCAIEAGLSRMVKKDLQPGIDDWS